MKDFPGTWAEYRVYDGGILQVVHRVSSPEALAWSEECRDLYSDFGVDYASYAMGTWMTAASRSDSADRAAVFRAERPGMSEFDVAEAAVQAALDAGARYADARVMHRRYEAMAARNGEVEDVTQDEDAGIGVRALVGSGWGFFAHPDVCPTEAAGRLDGGPPRSPRPARRVASGRVV